MRVRMVPAEVWLGDGQGEGLIDLELPERTEALWEESWLATS